LPAAGPELDATGGSTSMSAMMYLQVFEDVAETRMILTLHLLVNEPEIFTIYPLHKIFMYTDLW
jgi:hypothetical protein